MNPYETAILRDVADGTTFFGPDDGNGPDDTKLVEIERFQAWARAVDRLSKEGCFLRTPTIHREKSSGQDFVDSIMVSGGLSPVGAKRLSQLS